MKVLLTVTSTRLAYGGPAVSVTGLADSLFAAGVEAAIWSPQERSLECESIPSRTVAPRLEGDLDKALATFGRPDLIHDNGIWLLHHRTIAELAKRHGIARIVSTRGMLSPWALRHKGLKKRLAWLLYQRRDLESSQVIHATSEEEAKDLCALRLLRRPTVIPNGLPVLEPMTSRNAVDTARDPGIFPRRTMLFLGRIYPVKGLSLLLEAWAIAKLSNWRLLIVGPDEAGHRSELEAQCRRLGLEETVAFHGAVSGEGKETMYRQADIFVLPSLSESFGMSVAEAMAHGLPVMASTAVPWPVIAQRNLGWWVDPNLPDLAHALRIATTAPPETLKVMGQDASEYVRSVLCWKVLVPRYIDMYERAIRLKREVGFA